MTFEKDIKRGRNKGSTGNKVLVRRIKSDKYNTYHTLKDKKHKKIDRGQCRLTIPRAIADSMGLTDRCYVEFIDHTKTSKILRKVDEDELDG